MATPRPWKAALRSLAAWSSVILVAAGALYGLGLHLGRLDCKYDNEASARLSSEILSALGVEDGEPNTIARLERAKAEVNGIRALFGDTPAGEARLRDALRAALARSVPAASTTLIPDYVMRTFRIVPERTRNSADIAWNPAEARYDLVLERGVERGAFAGACWELGQHADLSKARELEVEMRASVSGMYDFKFERQRIEEGQANVPYHVSAGTELQLLRMPLSKVPPEIRQDMARFCLAIVGDTPGSPERATIAVRWARFR